MTVAHEVRSNPVPYALIGVGTAWLFWSYRSSRRQRSGYEYDAYRSAMGSTQYGASPYGEEYGTSAGRIDGDEGHRMNQARERVARAASGTRDYLSSRGSDVREGARRIGQGAVSGARRVGQQARRGAMAAQEGLGNLVEQNPLAVAGAALVAGVGVGLLVPTTPQENRLMGEARDRLVDEARETARQVKQAATHVKDAAVSGTPSV